MQDEVLSKNNNRRGTKDHTWTATKEIYMQFLFFEFRKGIQAIESVWRELNTRKKIKTQKEKEKRRRMCESVLSAWQKFFVCSERTEFLRLHRIDASKAMLLSMLQPKHIQCDAKHIKPYTTCDALNIHNTRNCVWFDFVHLGALCIVLPDAKWIAVMITAHGKTKGDQQKMQRQWTRRAKRKK